MQINPPSQKIYNLLFTIGTVMVVLLFLTGLYKMSIVGNWARSQMAAVAAPQSSQSAGAGSGAVSRGTEMSSFPTDADAQDFKLQTAYTLPAVNSEHSFQVFYWGFSRSNPTQRKLYVYDSSGTSATPDGIGSWSRWSDSQIAQMSPLFADFKPLTGYFVPGDSMPVVAGQAGSSNNGVSSSKPVVSTPIPPVSPASGPIRGIVVVARNSGGSSGGASSVPKVAGDCINKYHIQFWGTSNGGQAKWLVYYPCGGWQDSTALLGTEGYPPANITPLVGYTVPMNESLNIHLWVNEGGRAKPALLVYSSGTKLWDWDGWAVCNNNVNGACPSQVANDFIPKAGYATSKFNSDKNDFEQVVNLWGYRRNDLTKLLMYTYNPQMPKWDLDSSLLDNSKDVNAYTAYGKISQFNNKFEFDGGYSLISCIYGATRRCAVDSVVQVFGRVLENQPATTLKPTNFSYDFSQNKWLTGGFFEKLKVTSQTSPVTIARNQPFEITWEHYMNVDNSDPWTFSVWLKNGSGQYLVASNIFIQPEKKGSAGSNNSYKEKIKVDSNEEIKDGRSVPVGTYNLNICSSGTSMTDNNAVCGASLGTVTLTEDPQNKNATKNLLFSITDSGASANPRFAFSATSTRPDTWENVFVSDKGKSLPAKTDQTNEAFFANLVTDSGAVLYTKIYQAPVIFMTPGPDCFDATSGLIKDIPGCVGPWPDDLEMPCFKDANVLTLNDASGGEVGRFSGFGQMCK